MSDPWGLESPPYPCAEGLPEGQALATDGWRRLDGAPLYALLPAAWPDDHRTWAWYDEDDWLYEHVDEAARAAGLPMPPRGRIWLLRSPWPRIPLTAIYQLLWSMVEDRTPDEIGAMYRIALDVLRWPEDRALAACPEPERSLIEQWAAAGRVGEDGSPYVERRLAPDDINRLTHQTGLDEATALAWFDSLSVDDIEQAIGFIVSWRAAELPGDPPTDVHRYLHRDVAELRRWLDGGFDLYAAAELELAGLDRAIEWREAGFSAAQTYELLRSDPALTPDEAHAFTGLGIADPDRREWIYYGFTSEQAASWAAAGLRPDEARLWRATGHQPSDVGAGQRIPPELIAGRQYIAFSQSPDGRRQYAGSDELADPPGTRGRRARRWAHDPDPWINTD